MPFGPTAHRFVRGASLILCLALWGCGQESPPSEPALATLTGRAILPADTFAAGPAVGHQLEAVINGRKLPFSTTPIQGFSSLIPLGNNEYLALQDNGFGTMANSPNYPLRWYHLGLNLDDPPYEGGPVEVFNFSALSDPNGLLPFPITHGDSTRVLTGADLDPESFVAMPDGSYWIGEEFGPSLIHFSADGAVLEKPVAIPVAVDMRVYARGSPFLRTPDHPELRFSRHEETRVALANLPRSGGIEGLAINPAGDRLYTAIEKALVDDPFADRRVIQEFDPSQRSFTGNRWYYRVDRPDVSIASMEAVDSRHFLIVERDEKDGRDAEIKRIYEVELGQTDATGFLLKTLVCDLLNIDDGQELTRAERNTVGLGRFYKFPYVTPECLTIIDANTLLMANDNNYPMSAGRRPKKPDNNEFIRLHLTKPLESDPE
jgi:hypothetical protein